MSECVRERDRVRERERKKEKGTKCEIERVRERINVV